MPGMKRRDFLSGVGAAGLLAGVPSALEAASRLGFFEASPGDPDAMVFAAARKHFLIPAGVAYCNTGTLGASPVEVITALAEGNRKLEHALADWPYERPDGEPLTGYQELKDVRALAGSMINAAVDEVAIVQNATVGMSMLANGLDLAPATRSSAPITSTRGASRAGGSGRSVTE